MKKLGKFDKLGLKICFWGLVVLLTFRYFPLHRCEAHGIWLRRGRALPPANADSYNTCALREGCPHWGAKEDTSFISLITGASRYCPVCRAGSFREGRCTN